MLSSCRFKSVIQWFECSPQLGQLRGRHQIVEPVVADAHGDAEIADAVSVSRGTILRSDYRPVRRIFIRDLVCGSDIAIRIATPLAPYFAAVVRIRKQDRLITQAERHQRVDIAAALIAFAHARAVGIVVSR